jgi:hypothetical protein
MASADSNLKQEDKFFNFKKELMEDLEKDLTCFTCKKIPRNPLVSWCSTHHLMCSSCFDMQRHKSLICCQKAFSPFVATMLKKFQSKCKFTQNGCQVFMLLKELEVHEVDCVYRNINCPFLYCKAKNVSFIGLGDHLEANHGNLIKIGKARSKDVTTLWPKTTKWIPQELGFRNRSFFTEVRNDADSQTRHFWIYFHGTPEEAVHYTYQIKIIGGHGQVLTFTGNVYSLDEMMETVMAKRDVFILFDCQAKRFQVNNDINFEITLYSDKEEIKNEDVESGISDDEEQ